MESSKEKVGFFKDGDDKLFKGGFGFTKANELFVGRMAQLGFAASLIGELYTGDPFSPFFWHLWLWGGVPARGPWRRDFWNSRRHGRRRASPPSFRAENSPPTAIGGGSAQSTL